MKTSNLSLYAAEVSSGKVRLLDDYLASGKVLDLGCGNGLYGLHVVSKGCEVLQIDVADRRDERARHLPYRAMDAQRLLLPNLSFDHVLAFDIMEHLDDDMLFLKEVRRVCRQRLFLSVPNAEDDQLKKLALTHIHHKDKTHRRAYTKESLLAVLGQCGFKVLIMKPNFNTALPNFANALAKDGLPMKIAARLISLQCRFLEKAGWFENRCIGDWYCVAE